MSRVERLAYMLLECVQRGLKDQSENAIVIGEKLSGLTNLFKSSLQAIQIALVSALNNDLSNVYLKRVKSLILSIDYMDRHLIKNQPMKGDLEE